MPSAVRSAAVLTIGLLLSGCSASPDPAGEAASGAAAPAAASAPAAGTSPAATSGAAVPSPALAQAETSDNGVPLRIALTGVRVTGQLMTVSVEATNIGDAGATKKWQVSGFFSNGLFDAQGALAVPDGHSADGIYVLDEANAKRYLVARNPQKLCVCTGNLSAAFADVGQSTTVTATFKAPPPEVSTVTVVVPHVKAFTGITVQR